MAALRGPSGAANSSSLLSAGKGSALNALVADGAFEREAGDWVRAGMGAVGRRWRGETGGRGVSRGFAGVALGSPVRRGSGRGCVSELPA
jgi:hypothetical protein